jgi:hypothetical protein
MSTHWEMTPESGRTHLRRTFPAFAESLVDIILTGVQVVSGSAALAPISQDDGVLPANATRSAGRRKRR